MSPSPELRGGPGCGPELPSTHRVLEGASYRWYRDGQPLQEFTSASVSFAAITLSQAGAYHCQAQAPGSATTRTWQPVSLHVSCKRFDPICVSWGRRGAKGMTGEGDVSPWSWTLLLRES